MADFLLFYEFSSCISYITEEEIPCNALNETSSIRLLFILQYTVDYQIFFFVEVYGKRLFREYFKAVLRYNNL